MYDQSVTIGSLTLKNPVLTASGTFGYALEYDDFYDVALLGGICTKGLSLHPIAGNEPNRICETAAARPFAPTSSRSSARAGSPSSPTSSAPPSTSSSPSPSGSTTKKASTLS